jgi:HSP20 family molecular chaperone IbpA
MTSNTQTVSRPGAETTKTQPGNGQPAATTTGQTTAQRGRAEEERSLIPPVDVVEDANAITLYADLPGVAKDKLDVRVEADTLTIDGELALAMPEGIAASHAEVQTTRYRRTFTLSKELDAEQVEAEFDRGVLKLRIPKARDAQPRRIAVQVR